MAKARKISEKLTLQQEDANEALNYIKELQKPWWKKL